MEFHSLQISYYTTTVAYFESQPDRKIYFNPQESVGFGTTVSQTITRPYQYMGVTKDRSLLTRTIHLENHGLETNDELRFSVPTGGSQISCATSQYMQVHLIFQLQFLQLRRLRIQLV
ncbi:MAG: hypothetical protein CM15mV2_3390 [uncultured marine virus]|nr:MAG: hypothetical protein CM15mV2_3390 [uncultured marine virus]